jgi:3-hydroxyisobutyrate dehydrogenase-like beta-hydroxyacid dehydrogenase
MTKQQSVGIIGYGEVGRSLAISFAASGVPVSAFDLSFGTREGAPDEGVVYESSSADVAASSRVIFVCTPAAGIESVARDLAGHIEPHHLIVDLASATPESKVRAADSLGSASDAYVDVALSAPPLQDGITARMWASGPRADELIEWSDSLGMDIRRLGDRVGQATKLKILRATLTKGLEAILLESMSAALLHDMDPELILRTVESAFDDRPFQTFCDYLVSTGVVHDDRRAIEVGEAAAMAEEVGIESDMARAAERVLTRASQLHQPGDAQEFVSALRTYARHAT